MSCLYENPMAPAGHKGAEPDIQCYKPMDDSRMRQFLMKKNLESLVDLLDESLLFTESEEETEVSVDKTQEILENPIKLEEMESIASLNAFIAEYKNKEHSEKELKDKRTSRKNTKHSKQRKKSSRKDSKYKNKSVCTSSAKGDSLVSYRSTSQSSSSSTEGSWKQKSVKRSAQNRSSSPQQSTSLYKSSADYISSKRPTSPSLGFPSHQQYSNSRRLSIHTPSGGSPSPTRSSSPRRHTSPRHRSHSGRLYSESLKSHIRSPSQSPSPTRSSSSRRHASPSLRSSRKSHMISPSRSRSPTRSSPPRRHTSPRRRSHSGKQYSDSRKSHFRSPSLSPSPTRSSSSRRHASPSRRCSRKSHMLSLSRSPSPTRSSSSRRHTPPSRRSSRKSHMLSPSRSPSPTRSSPPRRHTSPSRRSHSGKQYSDSRKSNFRAPSRSPSLERLPSRYPLSTYERSPNIHSSHSNQGRSFRRSPSPRSQVHSPERPSSLYKSYKKSSKVRLPPSPKSSMHQQSLSPHGSPSHDGSSVHSDRSSNHPKSSVDGKSKHNKSLNRSPVRRRKFPTDDEYSQMLAEELKRRELWEGSSTEEGEVDIEKMPVPNTETENPIEKQPANKRVVEDDLQSNSRIPQQKLKEIKSEPLDQKGFAFNSYYCSVCQLGLNSEVTWQSHISGKKHAKALKLQTVHEIAKSSIAPPSTAAPKDTRRFGKTPPGKTRRQIMDVPRIQPAIDDCTSSPILGLQTVWEIRSQKEISYYCEICDAPCSPSSIMPHLVGHKHKVQFVKEIDPEWHDRNINRHKKELEFRLDMILSDHEKRFGRGRMKVFEEFDDTEARPTFGADSQPGPSWRNSAPIKKEVNTESKARTPSCPEYLDTSRSNYRCTLCDSFMNGLNMWEAHVIGKRHLANAKKIPGENISKVRSVRAPPHVASKLDQLIQERAADEIIVGLDSIRETQGPNGENYTCFPCGSNCTSFDIVDHLLLTKHKIRYLENLVADGKECAITEISKLEIHNESFRKNLIDDECRNMMELYGSGTAEVYIAS